MLLSLRCHCQRQFSLLRFSSFINFKLLHDVDVGMGKVDNATEERWASLNLTTGTDNQFFTCNTPKAETTQTESITVY